MKSPTHALLQPRLRDLPNPAGFGWRRPVPEVKDTPPPDEGPTSSAPRSPPPPPTPWRQRCDPTTKEASNLGGQDRWSGLHVAGPQGPASQMEASSPSAGALAPRLWDPKTQLPLLPRVLPRPPWATHLWVPTAPKLVSQITLRFGSGLPLAPTDHMEEEGLLPSPQPRIFQKSLVPFEKTMHCWFVSPEDRV